MDHCHRMYCISSRRSSSNRCTKSEYAMGGALACGCWGRLPGYDHPALPSRDCSSVNSRHYHLTPTIHAWDWSFLCRLDQLWYFCGTEISGPMAPAPWSADAPSRCTRFDAIQSWMMTFLTDKIEKGLLLCSSLKVHE